MSVQEVFQLDEIYTVTCSRSSPARSEFVSFNTCNFLIRSCLTGGEEWDMLTKQNHLNGNSFFFFNPALLPCVDLQCGLQYLSSLLCRPGQLLGAEEVACSTHLQHCDHSRVGVQTGSQLEGESHSQTSLLTINPTKAIIPASSVPLCLQLWCPKFASSRRWGRRPAPVSNALRLQMQRGRRVRTTAAAAGVLLRWRHQGAADLACVPQTSPPCSDPPRCRSPPRSSSFCRTPGGAAGSARQTARSRTAPTEGGGAGRKSNHLIASWQSRTSRTF